MVKLKLGDGQAVGSEAKISISEYPGKDLLKCTLKAKKSLLYKAVTIEEFVCIHQYPMDELVMCQCFQVLCLLL